MEGLDVSSEENPSLTLGLWDFVGKQDHAKEDCQRE